MRIPSTKRICFVGQKGSFNSRLESFIEEKRNKAKKGFVPRDISEELRLKNCQNLDKSKRDEFIARIVKKLESSEEEESVSISSLVDNFSAEEKALLKSECGGFQTLIKNNRQLFHVQVRPRNSDFMHFFFLSSVHILSHPIYPCSSHTAFSVQPRALSTLATRGRAMQFACSWEITAFLKFIDPEKIRVEFLKKVKKWKRKLLIWKSSLSKSAFKR